MRIASAICSPAIHQQKAVGGPFLKEDCIAEPLQKGVKVEYKLLLKRPSPSGERFLESLDQQKRLTVYEL